METTQSTTGVDVATSKSKFGSHSSLTSTSSLVTPDQNGRRQSHPLLSNRCSASDSRLSNSCDNAKSSKRTSRSAKNRLRQLDLSLDSKPAPLRQNAVESTTEDEDRTSTDDDSATEDDGENSLSVGGGNAELNASLNSSSFSYVDKAVEELVTTERTYVRDLNDVIQVAVVTFADEVMCPSLSV